ncbi:MAG TPA: polysaccharide deacetylase family protein [Candidatus Sumerlaeota bacterium]|nr:polysaccharide deacetylase family protein [Candidatus Sumerlaeota bacterium]
MKPTAFIHVDMDGAWAIRRCYGLDDGAYFDPDPVYEEGVPRILDTLGRKGLPAGFFIVGRDMEAASKRILTARMAMQGHEIGNHSQDHHIGLTALSNEEIRQHISEAQNAITGALQEGGVGSNAAPVGFRAPGYDADRRVWGILRDLGFLYDTSVIPTPWGFLMRLTDSYISGKAPWKKRQYGRLSWGWRSLAPGLIEGPGILWEIPVSVTPRLRFPMHFSMAQKRGFDFFRCSAEQYLERGLPLLYLFHGIDFTETRGLTLLPSSRGRDFFDTRLEDKVVLAERILDWIGGHFEVARVRDWISKAESRSV